MSRGEKRGDGLTFQEDPQVVGRRDAERLQIGLLNLLRQLVHLGAERAHVGLRLGQLLGRRALLVEQLALLVAGRLEIAFDSGQLRVELGREALFRRRDVRPQTPEKSENGSNFSKESWTK